MSHTTTDPAGFGPITPEGALLNDIYGRLVALHHGLATHALPDADLRRLAMREVKAILGLITENPQFQTADDADQAAFEGNRQAAAEPRA